MAEGADDKKTRRKIMGRFDEIANIVASIDDNLTDARYDWALSNLDQLVEESILLREILDRVVNKNRNA